MLKEYDSDKDDTMVQNEDLFLVRRKVLKKNIFRFDGFVRGDCATGTVFRVQGQIT
jgi:hypothetical protein